MIARITVEHGLVLLYDDRDFEAIAAAIPGVRLYPAGNPVIRDWKLPYHRLVESLLTAHRTEERAQLVFPVRHLDAEHPLEILSLLVTGQRGRLAGSGYWSEGIGFTLARPTVDGER